MKNLDQALESKDVTPSVGWSSDQPASITAGVAVPTLLWVAVLIGVLAGISITGFSRS